MKSERTITEELKSLEKKLFEQETRSSSLALSSMISDDFIEFGSSGKRYTKKGVIRALGEAGNARISISNFSATALCKDHYLVTYKSRKRAGEKRISALRSSVWRLRNQKWQIIFHQGTLIKDD